MSNGTTGQGPVIGPPMLSGEGSPEGVVTSSVGAIYRRTDESGGSKLYVKETGDNTDTGWVQGGGNPSGTILDFAGNTPPVGYIMCYGQSLDKASFPDLFAAIGYAYGGSGANFNVPDCRGRVVAGEDDMGGTPALRITVAASGFDGTLVGAAGGSQTHALVIAELPSHNHTGVDHIHVGVTNHLHLVPNHQHLLSGCLPEFTGSGRGAGTSFSLQASGRWTDATGQCWTSGADRALSTGGADRSLDTGYTGSNTAHHNMQPTIIFKKIIKT